jgi:plasmid stabilization system protein ParE
MATSRKLVWSPKAREDFQAIIEYLLANWNEKTSQKFMDITFIAVDYISRHPGHFPLINKKLKVRKCVLTRQNSLFYSVHRNEIAILRIFDTRQNPEKLKF